MSGQAPPVAATAPVFPPPSSGEDAPRAFPLLLTGDPLPYLAPPSPRWEARPSPSGRFEIHGAVGAYDDIVRALRAAPEPDGLAWQRLYLHAVALECEAADAAAGERLLVEEHCADRWRQAGVVPYPHQLHVVRRVLTALGGRAILADEVGLGKTVEAGMILKEYMLRGLVRRALILVPATLVWQWHHELQEKFGIQAAIQRTAWDWERCPILIASLDTAKRPPHRDRILAQRYDMLVVDEAHRLKNRRSLNWQFVNAIHRHYCLLLTATPVQNRLDELHSLVTLLKPGHLGSARFFQRLFAHDARRARDPEQLRRLLAHVMIRHRRGRDTVDFTPRHVHPVPVELSPSERHFYDALSAYVRNEAAHRLAGASSDRPPVRSLLPFITLQKEAVSSALAAALTLRKLIAASGHPDERAALEHLLALACSVQEHAKADAVLRLLRETDEQFIIFTEFRATQHVLQQRLETAGISHVTFDGTLSLGQRLWARELFRRGAQVLISTESGGEGINFQFCRNVVHFDLPWNPQRIEQRIGRVHRLGQTRPVHIYNLATRDTIEEYMLYLLDEKLDLFRQVVGQQEAPWSQRPRSFEAAIARIVLTSPSRDAIYAGLDRLGEQLQQAARDRKGDLVDRILGGQL